MITLIIGIIMLGIMFCARDVLEDIDYCLVGGVTMFFFLYGLAEVVKTM